MNIYYIQITHHDIGRIKFGQMRQMQQDPQIEDNISRLQENPKDIGLWLSLAYLVKNDRDKKYCYGRILQLDPSNSDAKTGLAAIRRKRNKSVLAWIGAIGSTTLFCVGLAIYDFDPTGWREIQMDPDGMGVMSIRGATIGYYDIKGENWGELFLQMDLQGPQTTAGDKGWGLTHVEYSPSYEMDENQCRKLEKEFDSYIQVVVPRWINPQDGTEAMRAEWRRFILFVAQHEAWHVHIDRIGLAKIAFINLVPDCRWAAQAEQDIAAEVIREQDEYEQQQYPIANEFLKGLTD